MKHTPAMDSSLKLALRKPPSRRTAEVSDADRHVNFCRLSWIGRPVLFVEMASLSNMFLFLPHALFSCQALCHLLASVLKDQNQKLARQALVAHWVMSAP